MSHRSALRSAALSGLLLTLVLPLLFILPGRALDLSGGLLKAVPVPAGKPPTLTGNDADWDLSGAEPFWIAYGTARKMNALAAVEYDADNLYLYVRVHLPDRPLQNTNGPSDPFWNGDMVEFRLASDPALSHPLPFANDRRIASSNRICHLSFWRNTTDGKDYVHIAYGGSLQAGQTLNPPGARLALTNRREGCLLEAVIPWTALNAPGGKNPFSPGQRMSALLDVHWEYNDMFTETAAIYDTQPGQLRLPRDGAMGPDRIQPRGSSSHPPRHDGRRPRRQRGRTGRR